MTELVCLACGKPLKGRQIKWCSDKCRVSSFHRGTNAAKEKTKRSCSHPKTHIIETSLWNGSKYETRYHCGKCGRILKKERVQLGNRTFKTQYVEQEAGNE